MYTSFKPQLATVSISISRLILTSVAYDVDDELSKQQLGILHASTRTRALKVIGNYSPRVADLLQVMVLASSEMTFGTSEPPQTLEIVNVSVSMGFVETIPQSVKHLFSFKPPLMALNFDVLVVVMACSSGRSDIVHMMCTCRTLYQAGIPYLLAGKIHLLSRRKFLSFCCFMLCDPTYGRFRYLRNLKVGNLGRNIYGVAGAAAAALFQNAKYLESLELSNVDFFTYDKRIPQAISSYTSLRNMTLGTVSDNTSMMFLEMCSPLKKITVDFGRIHDWGYSPVDPLPLFKSFKDSLEEMRVSCVLFSNTPATIYSNVTDLYVEECWFVDITSVSLPFPNLRNLGLWMNDENWRLDDIDRYREDNMQSRERQQWKFLHSLRGSVRTLYMFALCGKVGHLDLQCTSLHAADSDKLYVILLDIYPFSLSIGFKVPGFDPSTLGHFLMPANETLTELLVSIEFYGEDHGDPISQLVGYASHSTTT